MEPERDITRPTDARSAVIIRLVCGILIGAMSLAALGPPEACALEQGPGEYEVKAAFLYNFVKFAYWPADKGTLAARVINLCILGEDPFGSAFDFIHDEPAGERRLVIRRLGDLQKKDECQVLFISASERGEVRHIVRTLKGANILTVGDTEGFAQMGVIINFYIERKKVRFEINLEALRQSGLSISSKVMHLARIIRDR